MGHFDENNIILLVEDTSLGDIFYFKGENSSINSSDDYEPKYKIRNPDRLLRKKIVMGNLIIKKMKTSGGTDLDWIIEHNNHFLIIQPKVIRDEFIIINKSQMQFYEALYLALTKCVFFIIAHKDIDFKNPQDPIWLLDMRNWTKNTENIKTKSETTSSKEYAIDLGSVQKITVDILRDIIDAEWENMK